VTMLVSSRLLVAFDFRVFARLMIWSTAWPATLRVADGRAHLAVPRRGVQPRLLGQRRRRVSGGFLLGLILLLVAKSTVSPDTVFE